MSTRGPALGVLEVGTIARGVVTADAGLKRSPAPMHVSKVAHVTGDGKPTRVRFETRDGKKVRVAVKSGEVISG